MKGVIIVHTPDYGNYYLVSRNGTDKVFKINKEEYHEKVAEK
jgi:hypothetical protein